MKKLHLLALLPIFAFTTQVAMAAPVDDGPPAQQQKNAVPDSTSSGNYLENEAGDNTGAVNEDSTQAADKKSKNSKSNVQLKGKSHKKTPEKGGVEVN